MPTAITPSTTLSVPFPPFSPLPHLIRLCFSPSFYALSVRYLAEQESPTHPNFIADPNAVQRVNALMDKCADLMSSLWVFFIFVVICLPLQYAYDFYSSHLQMSIAKNRSRVARQGELFSHVS